MIQRFQKELKSVATIMGIAISIISLLSACGRGSEDSADSVEVITVPVDSVMNDTTDFEAAKDSADKKEKPLRIRSKAEIMEFIENSPNRERYEAGIIPTMAEYVPEYASRLLDNTCENGFLIVDKNTMRLYRYDKYGVEQEHVGIACARNYGTKHKKADSRTPEGYFSISGIYDSTDWLFTDDNGYTSPAKGSFGPRFMRIAPQIGIHGTSSPGSIGGRRSHGCIRMTNENIMRIHKLCAAGMPVIVSPGPRDMAVNEKEGYHIPAVPVVKGGRPCVAGKYSAYEQENSNKEKAKSETTQPSDSIAVPSASVKDSEVIESQDELHKSAPEPAAPSAPSSASPSSTPETSAE